MPKDARPSTPELVVLLLFPGFSNLCLANAVEPLRAANTLARRPLYRWRFIAMEDEPLHSSSGLPVRPEALGPEVGRHAPGDAELWPCTLATPDTLRRLRGAAGRFGLVAGLDTGSWLMARAGLLNGYRATSHWDVLSSLEEGFPEVDVVTDRFVIDRDRASCGGATATLDLMLELIGRRHGTALALDVAALFLYGGGAARPAAAYARPAAPDPAGGGGADAAATWRSRLTIAAIATSLGLSQRQAGGAVPAHADLTPVQLYRRIRLAEARRRILETTQSVAEIAGRCGYGDPAAMTRAFRAAFGATPTDLRRNAAGVAKSDATAAARAILSAE
jgi:transcriptional regulator GlxA family with amidase domain